MICDYYRSRKFRLRTMENTVGTETGTVLQFQYRPSRTGTILQNYCCRIWTLYYITKLMHKGHDRVYVRQKRNRYIACINPFESFISVCHFNLDFLSISIRVHTKIVHSGPNFTSNMIIMFRTFFLFLLELEPYIPDVYFSLKEVLILTKVGRNGHQKSL